MQGRFFCSQSGSGHIARPKTPCVLSDPKTGILPPFQRRPPRKRAPLPGYQRIFSAMRAQASASARAWWWFFRSKPQAAETVCS